MPPAKSIPVLAALAAAALSSSCAVAPSPNPEQKEIFTAQWVNPNPPGTYAHFTSEPTYPKTYDVYKDPAVLAGTSPANARVEISLSRQRAVLYRGSDIAMDYPIASGTRSFPTPPGKYEIVEKIRSDKRSNLYGTIYTADGKVHKSNADISKDKVPAGGDFKGAAMPYWMRLTWSGVGMHQGKVPRYPASHGCVRIPSGVASTIFSKTGIGTPVSIVR